MECGEKDFVHLTFVIKYKINMLRGEIADHAVA